MHYSFIPVVINCCDYHNDYTVINELLSRMYIELDLQVRQIAEIMFHVFYKITY